MSPRALLVIALLVCCATLSAAQTPNRTAPHNSQPSQTLSSYAVISGAERVGSAQCAACHEELAKPFHRTTHAQQDVECEDCHGGGSLHVQGGDKAKILRIASQPADIANGTCLGCHKDNEHLQNWTAGAHQRNHVRCMDCHKIHVAEPKLASRREQNEGCLNCHRKQDAEGRLPYHHPVVREAKMSCADCHDPHGGTAANNLRTSSLNELCFQCHAEYQGPFTFQHVPVTESCAKCHSAHGSPNRNLLKVSEPVLCLQCHSGHHNGTGNPLLNRCTNCHSAIHGTDTPSATGGSVFIDK